MNAEATAALIRFVLYFPLPVMLSGFAARLPVNELFGPAFHAAQSRPCLSRETSTF